MFNTDLWWLYIYVIPMVIVWISIYVHFRYTIFKEGNSDEKRNLYELTKRYEFGLWMSIFPVANILLILIYIMIQILERIQEPIKKILKKIKI